MKLEILNTSILTAAGTYKMVPIPVNHAKALVRAARAAAQLNEMDY